MKKGKAFSADYLPVFNALHCSFIAFLCILNIITTKTTLLPVLYFPSLDRVIGLIFE